MTKLRRLTLIYTRNVFIYLILCCISSFALMMIYKDIKPVYMQFFLCIPFLVVFEVKRWAGNVFVFFGLNIAILVLTVAASLWFTDELFVRVFVIIYMVVTLGISVFTRLSSGHEEIDRMFLIVAITVNAVLTFMANYFGAHAVEPIFITCSLIQFLLYIVYTRVSRIDYALEIIESTSVQPIDKILSFNNLITGLFVMLMSVVVIASVVFHAENLIYLTGRILLRFIRFLASLTNSNPEEIVDVEMPTLPSGQGFDLSLLGEPGEPFFLFVIIEKIFFFAMYVLIICGIIFGIGFLCYRIYKRFNDKIPENGDIKEFLLPEILIRKTGGIFVNAREFFGGLFVADDNNKRVRRIFYKKVSGHISKGVSIAAEDTPDDISNKIREKEDVSFLTGMYHKARYSNEILTDAEVHACKGERK